MNDLPGQPSGGPNDNKSVPPQQPVAPAPVVGGKEGERGSPRSAEMPLKAVGAEVNLPKEVVGAGVQVHPTTIALPGPVAQMGVQTVKSGVATQATGASIVLPLTDDQIALALRKGVKESIRWLAEWCVKRIKQAHKKIVH